MHLVDWKAIRISTSFPPSYLIMHCLFCSNVTDFIQVYGKNYFQMEHYIPKRLMEKMALPGVRDELATLHASNANMLRDDAEIEFLKVIEKLVIEIQQFVRVFRSAYIWYSASQ